MAAIAAAALVHTVATHSPPLRVCAGLALWFGLAARHARRAGRDPAGLARDGDEWYLVPASDPGVGAATAQADRHRDPLTLHRPRYRSGWLIVLELRDATGTTRTLDVWADAVDARTFSALHLACLFEAAPDGAR